MLERLKGSIKYVWHAAVVLGLVLAAVKYVNGGDFWKAVARFNWAYAPFILTLTAGYVVAKGWRFATTLKELVPARRAMIIRGYVAAQACTLLPGGIAARAGVLQQAGISVSHSAASIAMSSIADQIVLVFLAIISALYFDQARRPVLILLSVILLISVLLGIEAARTWLKSAIDRFLKRFKLLDSWRTFVNSMKEVTTWRLIAGGVANTVIAFAFLLAALMLSIKGVGASIGFMTILLAFTLPQIMGRISALPGGVGVTEAGMVGILNAAPGITLDTAAAATAIYRVGTVLWAAVLGALVYFMGWRGEEEKEHIG